MKDVNVIVGFSDKEGVYFYKTDGESATNHTHEFERDGRERFMRFSFVARHLRWLQGEVLTVLEASMPEGRQLEAAKDLVRDKFSAKISWIYEICGMPENEQDALSYSND